MGFAKRGIIVSKAARRMTMEELFAIAGMRQIKKYNFVVRISLILSFQFSATDERIRGSADLYRNRVGCRVCLDCS